jgi:hypothetical protein
VHVPVLELLNRDGLADRLRIESTLDAAAELRADGGKVFPGG